MEKMTPKELLKEFSYPVVSVDLTSIRGVYRTLTDLRDWVERIMKHMSEDHLSHLKETFPHGIPELPEESIFYSLPIAGLHDFLVNFRRSKEYWNKTAIQVEVLTNASEQEERLQFFLCSIVQNTVGLIQAAIRTPTELKQDNRNQHMPFPGGSLIIGLRQMPPQQMGEEEEPQE
jgi:hypothetical protein